MPRQSNRFVPSLESLGERVNLSPAAPIGDPVTFTFTLGSLPAAPAERVLYNPYITIDFVEQPANSEVRHRLSAVVDRTQLSEGEEVIVLPDGVIIDIGAIRHRFFAVVDRTQLSGTGVVLLASSVPEGNTARSGRIVLWVRDVDRDPSEGGRGGPFIELYYRSNPDVLPVQSGDGLITFRDLNDARSAGPASPRPTIILQRLANPSLPNSQVQGTLFIAKQQALRDRAPYGVRNDGGGANEFVTIGGPRVETAAEPPGAPVDRLPSRFILRERSDFILVSGAAVEARSNVYAVWLTVGFFEVADEPSGSTTAPRRNLVTTLSADVGRPGGTAYEGTHALYQDIYIPNASAGPYVFARDGKSSGL